MAAAARDVLVPLIGQLPPELVKQACIDAGVASVEAAYTAALAAIPDSPAKAQGIALGQAAAAAILAQRAEDHGTVGPFLNTTARSPSLESTNAHQVSRSSPLRYGQMSPPSCCRTAHSSARAALRGDRAKFTTDFNEVKSLGGDGITTPSARTADQTEIALFWLESSPLKWNRIARTVATDKGLNLWENARLFGLLNMALADGYIAMAASKNHYNYWRPVTAIQQWR